MEEHSKIVLFTLIAYKVALLLIAWWGHRRTQNIDDYILGGRKLGPWVVALSASASTSSAWTLLGFSGVAWAIGLSAFWIIPGLVGGFIFNWVFIAPRLRRQSIERNTLTLTSFLSHNHSSKKFVYLASGIIVFCFIFYVASQLQGAGKTFHRTFDFGLHGETKSILLGGAIIMVYTIWGGFWAVSLTDALQGLIMAFVAIALPWAAIEQVGGLSAMFAQIQQLDIEGFGSFFYKHHGLAALGFVISFVGIGLPITGQPHVVNRFMAVENEAAMKKAQWIAVLWSIILYCGMMTLGLCARLLVSETADREDIFTIVTHQLFSPVMAGLMLAGVLSAIMSTADSQLLVAGSSLTWDLKQEKQSALRKSRWMILWISCAALLLALYGNKSIFDKVLFAWGALGAAFGPLLMVTLFRRPVRENHAVVAMCLGFFSAVLCYFFLKSTAWERVLPFALAFIPAWLGSKMIPTE